MATTGRSESQQAARQGAPRPLRWTPAEYDRLAESGFFLKRRVELIEGEIIVMTPLNPPHVIALDLTAAALRAIFGPGYYVRTQAPLELGRSRPEPDIAVVRGQPRDYVRHPQTALLVVEVSDTSLRYDRVRKGHLCARSGIPDYWILNLNDRSLEVHRLPAPDPSRRGRFSYTSVTRIAADGHAEPLHAAGSLIAVADLLP